MFSRARTPALVFVVAAVVYVAMLGSRTLEPSSDNHYAHLAASFLHGQLGVLGNVPPGTNDWACFDTVDKGPCPAGQYKFSGADAERYRWYVSFPPLPAVVLLPFVAIGGTDIPDRLIWAIFAGLGPALLYSLLRFLSESRRSLRTDKENLALTALFAFGSVYFFTAVQGTVWYAANVVGMVLTILFAHFAVGARRPVLAGSMLGLALLTRPTVLLLGIFFVVEALSVARGDRARPDDLPWEKKLFAWLRGVELRSIVRPALLFAAPIVVVGLLAMWMNHARFGDPFEFGHTFLQVKWHARIERWGLFHYHYFAKNLAVFVASLPWISRSEPFITISRHGLALWFTTPALLLVFWPKRIDPTLIGVCLAAAAVCIANLCYQNSGWVQFGYRFALDYLSFLFVALALGGRRFGKGFYVAMAFALIVNTFGAVTWDRAYRFYDRDRSQQVLFQPD